MEVQKIESREKYVENSLSFLQSWSWGELKSPQWEPLRLNIGGSYIQILMREIPILKYKLAYIPRPFGSDGVSAEVLEALTQYLRSQHKISHIIIDPNQVDELSLQAFTSAGFISGGEQTQPNATGVIDLSMTEDQFLQEVGKKRRKMIRSAQRDGLVATFHTVGDKALDQFWGVMEDIVRQAHYLTHPKAYFDKILRTFGVKGESLVTIVKDRDNAVIAGFLGIIHGGTYSELYGGVTEIGREVTGAGYFTKLAIFQELKNRTVAHYDLWGMAPLGVDGDFELGHRLYDISHFKRRLSPTYIEFLPQQSYVVSKIPYLLYNLGIKLHKILISLRK